jgi:hypothetical protein
MLASAASVLEFEFICTSDDSLVVSFVPVSAPDTAGGLGPLAEEFLRLKKPSPTPLPILLPSLDLLL